MFLKWLFIVIPFLLYLSLGTIILAMHSDKEELRENIIKSAIKNTRNYREEPI